jgi:hypothetical protein
MSEISEIKVQLDSDGIMRVEYPHHKFVTLDDVQKEYRKRLNITHEKTPLLVKVHGVTSFDAEAQQFLCGSEHCAITLAAAVVTDSQAGYFEYTNMLMAIFKELTKPLFDFEVFEDEAAALKWLKTYLASRI